MLNMDYVVVLSVICISIVSAIMHYIQYRLNLKKFKEIEENVMKQLGGEK